MNLWSLPTAAPVSPVQLSLSRLIAAIGQPQFGAQALQALNGTLAAASWSVYQRFADRPPVLHLSASAGVADSTQACFDAYCHTGLYRRDAVLDAVRGPTGQPVLLRMHAREAPNADHREAIYHRHGLLERLSVASPQGDGSVLAINLYHHAHQGLFGEGEVQRFAELAPLLLAGVTRHLQLGETTPPPVREALSARCAALTTRELDVLERVLKGMSYDGIAADLGLSLATVKTYRARAFGRLDLHFKSELFAAFVAA